ncbi:MAG: 3-isopropylmalate dehydratase small subunit [Pseudomonadota bacterium]
MEAFRQLDAVAAPLGGVNTDTDQILPALYLQKPRANNFGDYLFLDVRRGAQGERRKDFLLNDPVYADARILVSGRNFGCGSSREQAVWALFDGGYRAVIATSFGDIFASNALKNGLLPVVLEEQVVDALLAGLRATPGARVRIDLEVQTVTGPGIEVARFSIGPFSRQCLLEGMDEVDYTLSQSARIEDYEQAHPASRP